jgi:uncharacterized protein involved in exopolysaccharide biosynthesis
MSRRSSRLVLAIAAAAILVGVSCGLARSDKPVEVEATVLVVKKVPTDLLGVDRALPTFAEDYIGTQVALIRSPAIISRALKKPQV